MLVSTKAQNLCGNFNISLAPVGRLPGQRATMPAWLYKHIEPLSMGQLPMFTRQCAALLRSFTSQFPCIDYNMRFQIDVESAADVQVAYAFSLVTGIHLSIKNSGHDYKGRSSSRHSLSLWVSRSLNINFNFGWCFHQTRNLQSVWQSLHAVPTPTKFSFIDQSQCCICSRRLSCSQIVQCSHAWRKFDWYQLEGFLSYYFQAGATWEQVYTFADARNITVIGGYAQTIAASGGWVQGGGHSVLSPNYGLGVDRVVSNPPTGSYNFWQVWTKLEFKVVTPDGRYRVANECQNKDLFWALRGGGGSTWGVVLEASHKAEPQLKLQVYECQTWFIMLFSCVCMEEHPLLSVKRRRTRHHGWSLLPITRSGGARKAGVGILE